MNTIRMGVSACLFLGLGGCGDDPPAKAEPEQSQKQSDPDRPETRNLQAADAVGYDGQALRRKVDGMLNENDKRQEELRKAMQGDESKPKKDVPEAP